MRNCALVASLVAVLLPGVAFGLPVRDTAKAKPFSITIKQTTLESTGHPPIDGTELVVGTMSGTFKGAEVAHINFPSPGAFTATATTFSPSGSVRSTQKGTGQLNQDGSIAGRGTGQIIGGSGAFKHATGAFTFTFYGPKLGGPVTFKIRGKISVPGSS